ncbi:MAG: flagellar hook-associated protein FlgL [Oscillospiraceae bacterium]|nr:flagellar hook-associated protein FlgL [Oscillospiraceae bacterium]
MRITNSMLVGNLMRNLNTNLSRLDALNNQMATGRKYAHISDDPVALVYSQAARNKIARLSHYQRSVGSAQDWLNQAEVGIMELQSTLVNAYDAAMDAANDTKTDDDRKNIAKTIAQYRDHFVDTLNTTFGDKYVFGGYNTPGDPAAGFVGDGVKPFVVRSGELFYNGFNMSRFDGMDATDFFSLTTATILPDGSTLTAAELAEFNTLQSDVLSFDVGPGITMPVTMNGTELVFFITTNANGDTVIRNAFNVLEELYQNVETGAPVNDIGASIKPLQDGQNHLLTRTAEIGGRVRRLDLLEARYEQDEINYARMMSDAEDVDAAEVILMQKMAEAVYQAALSAGARIIQPTLMDFLR